jgi:major membrane immunogen (membrane-anchored lipoprotein)
MRQSRRSAVALCLAAAALLAGCGQTPLAERLIGAWTIQNPDRGEDLKTADDRMAVGGEYRFMPGGKVSASLQFRDKDGKLTRIDREGTWRVADGKKVEIVLPDLQTETFEATDATLTRISVTAPRTVWESKVVLQKSPG